MGLHRAWPDAEIIGVDNKLQRRYPFRFVWDDAMTFPLEGYDFIWASPPCQAHTALKTMWNAKKHPELVEPTRERLKASGSPYVIENVPGAPLQKGSILLCGTMFGLQTKDGCGELRRHRFFEVSHAIGLTPPCRHDTGGVIGVYGGHGQDRRRSITVVSKGGGQRRNHGQSFPVHQRREAMGIDWMTDYELSQAIPPAYSEFIARQFSL